MHPFTLSQQPVEDKPVQPLYVKLLPESKQLRGAVVSPDGKSIWAVVDGTMVDVGVVLNQNAFAISSTLTVALLAVLSLWLGRAARRRRVVGALHCRRCDYEVTGIVAAGEGASPAVKRCPECGIDLRARPPRKGLSRLRRLGVPSLLLALVLGAYGWFALGGRKMYPTPFPQGRWGSITLHRWSATSGLGFLSKATTRGDVLLELDTETGSTRRTVVARPNMTFFEIDYNPHARALYLAGPANQIDLVSVADGSVVASFNGAVPQRGGSVTPVVAGYDTSGNKVYFDCAEPDGSKSWLIEWNWRTGDSRRLAVGEGWKGQPYPSPAHHMVMPGEPLRILRYTDFGEAYTTKHYRLTLIDEAGSQLRSADLGERVEVMGVPSFSRDGSMIFMISRYGGGVLAYDSTTLEEVGSLYLGNAGSSNRAVVRSDGRLMLVPGYRSIHVRDIAAKAPLAPLAFPATAYAARSIHFSDDGCTVCAIFQSNGQSGFEFPLGVWRLPESLKVKTGTNVP